MSISPDLISNQSEFGDFRVFAPFKPAAYHTRIFLAYLGDFFIGGRVTTVSGEKSAERQTFQLTLAGAAGIADLIQANIDEPLVIYGAWRDNYSGEILEQSPILSGKITGTAFSKGGKNSTLMVYCRDDSPAESLGTVHQVEEVEYFSFGDSGVQIRLPMRLSFEVGDRVVFSDGDFMIQKINYTIDTKSALMTVVG